ncbi:uncharacterized protein LOC116301208 [Actinia tenebrosa]|uniref:Uncharacterized protein LOC116301208 n=1 Tax=Actinia tenebrosa TaxID=6105 RepID=A0A6P8IGY6_ACTTE|nr:uncharacterized protein LOC116301208 [Actinia tenebrosa]
MPWSETQRKRLAMEKEILESYFKDKVSWNNPTSDTSVEVKMTTSNDHHYTLRTYLPGDYPNSCPELTVASPQTLKRYDGSLLNGSASSMDHTYGTKNGLVKICHFRPQKWTDEFTLYQVFMKGLLWLEAYESHLRTGKSLATYLREM